MFKALKCTCGAINLLFKSFVSPRSRCRRLLSLYKLKFVLSGWENWGLYSSSNYHIESASRTTLNTWRNSPFSLKNKRSNGRTKKCNNKNWGLDFRQNSQDRGIGIWSSSINLAYSNCLYLFQIQLLIWLSRLIVQRKDLLPTARLGIGWKLFAMTRFCRTTTIPLRFQLQLLNQTMWTTKIERSKL